MIGGVFKEKDHYEVHVEGKVEFWSLDFKQKLGESKKVKV